MTETTAQKNSGESRISTDNAVPMSVFDISHMPLQQAIAAWSEAMGVFHDVRLHNPPEQFLRTRMQAWHLGEAFVGWLETVPQEFKRSRYHIGLGGGDCYAVNFIEDGAFYCPELDQLARPGDMIIRDKAEPLTFHAKGQMPGTTYHTLGLIIPQRLLEPFLTLPERKSAMIYDGRLPLVALLRQHLGAFKAQLSDMTLPQAQAVIQPTVEMLAAAMNGAITETNANAVRHAVVRQIQRYIEVHIEDPALSPVTIATAFGMSTRKLYQLFEPFDGVVAYIQKQRLSLVHAAIVDPDQQHQRIQEIAERFGFMQRKNFNAAFRRAYGITPREVRAYALEGRSRNMRQAHAKQGLWNWMLELR